MTHLIGNPEDLFSRNSAHFIVYLPGSCSDLTTRSILAVLCGVLSSSSPNFLFRGTFGSVESAVSLYVRI